MPLAVPGRCRQTMSPATWMRVPSGMWGDLGRGADGARQAGAEQAEWVIAGREPHDGVIASHLLPGTHRTKLDHILLDWQRE